MDDKDKQDLNVADEAAEAAEAAGTPAGADAPAADEAADETAPVAAEAGPGDADEVADETAPVAAEAGPDDADEAVEAELEAESLFLDLPDEAEAAGGEDAPAVAAQSADAAVAAPADEDLSEEEQRERERRAKMRWFVIHANTGHENKVKRNIEMAIKSNHMEEYFGEVLVATQEVTEMKNGKRSTVKRKFFPSYVLVEMIMDKTTQHFINSIPGVTRFVGGTPLKPEPITKEEVDRILGRISTPQEAKQILEIPYQVGESVQVIDGPFTDWIGVINDINHDKGKLKVMISIFGSETPVELDFLQVKSV
jgi:transcriptional antiterminator NusG